MFLQASGDPRESGEYSLHEPPEQKEN